MQDHTDAADIPAQMRLRAGPLSMLFEPANGFLRHIRLDRHEVLRGIYAAVRDHNWGTIEPRISNLRVDAGTDSFGITFDVSCVGDGVDFFWNGSIRGQADGTVVYTFDGIARSTFKRNRIGFCVLHPIEGCAGRPCRVTRIEGSIEEGMFPAHIAPHQPFKDMKSISHEVAPGLLAEVSFDGDVFEMEDQRNWTDASFKTYCTPLGLPFPVEVPIEARVRQSVTLRLVGSGVRSKTHSPQPDVVCLSISTEQPKRLPLLGLCVASHGKEFTPREIERLKALHLHHLRVDLRTSGDGWRETLSRAIREATAIGVKLEVAVHLTDDAEAELTSLHSALDRLHPPVCWFLVYHIGEKSVGAHWVELARKHLSHYNGAKIGGGTNAYFAELNRNRPPAQGLDVVCYSINPQVHAFDNDSLAETLEAQAHTVESANAFCPSVPVAVSPITLKPRFNPNATGPQPQASPGRLPEQVDARQPSLFAAAWTLGSIAALARSNTSSVTFYETTGWRGLMEQEGGCPLPELFDSLPGAVFSMYHVFADIGEMAEAAVLVASSTDPLSVNVLALRNGDAIRILAGNLSGRNRCVQLTCPLEGEIRIRRLDRRNAAAAATSPAMFRSDAGIPSCVSRTLSFELPAHGLIRIDGRLKEGTS